MTALSPADRAKLIGILGMLGSDHDGERANAARMADRLLRQHGLTWGDVLAPRPQEKMMPLMGTWRTKCADLLERRGDLRPWEERFVADLPKFRRLSVKQRYVLDEIVARVLGDKTP
jgi:hypothetical protein